MKLQTLLKSFSFSLLSFTFAAYANAENNTTFKASEKLVAAVLQPDNVEHKRVEYIWPQVMTDADLFASEQQVQSDEYWQTISGAELNRGVKVYVTGDALVRLAPKVHYQSGAPQVAPDLNVDELSFTQTDGNDVQISLLAAQEQMRSAGFSDGSVAMKVANLTNQPLLLRSNGAATSNAEYLLHVKEKDSPYQLSFKLPSHHNNGQNTLNVEANLNQQNLLALTTKVNVIAPSGELIAASFNNDKVVMNSAPTEYGARNGLYQVELHTLGNVGGKLVKRSAKLPFINIARTAEIVDSSVADAVYVNLNVAEAGRYNLLATLQGTNKQGQKVRLQTAEVAEFHDYRAKVTMPFELEKFGDFSDFELVDVKLTDQSRLMTLEVRSHL